MSITEVDSSTYARIHAEIVSDYVERGFSLATAREIAADEMRKSFVCLTAAVADETQEDSDDERDNDWTR